MNFRNKELNKTVSLYTRSLTELQPEQPRLLQ